MEGRSRRRRERALRLAGQGGRGPPGSDEDAPAARPPPPRHRRRRQPTAPEEDIIDGFAIISFKSYEDIEICLKSSREKGAKVAATLTVSRERPATPPPTRNSKIKRAVCGSPATRPPGPPPPPGSSNDEPALVKRESAADSEDNRISDASSRCSSGRGYICDSEGEDDKASDAGSVFSTTPPPIKKEPITVEVKGNGVVNGHGGKGPYRNGTTPVGSTNGGTVEAAAALVSPKRERVSPPPPAPPVRAASPSPATTLYQPLPPISTAVTSNDALSRVNYYGGSGYPATTAASYHPPPPALYAPYNNTPYLPPMGAASANSKEPVRYEATATVRPSSLGATAAPPRHSPRPAPAPASPHHESYSSNVSSLSRGSVGTPVSLPPYGATQQAAMNATPLAPAPLAPAPLAPPPAQTHHIPHQYTSKTVWSSSCSSSTLGPGSGESQRAGLGHFAPPLFPPTAAAPQPPTQPLSHQTVNPSPFSAESLFQSTKFQPRECSSDALRRELDTRFLVSQERGPFLRTEMHHHQHQHTHVHQHAPLLPVPPPPSASIYAAPIFKEMPKMDSSLFYRGGVGLAGYSPYSPAGLLTPSTPFAPPNHMPTFTPKQVAPEPSKPKPVKTGKWNAMHVRIAWEIYHHQQKAGGLAGAGSDGSKGLGGLMGGKPPVGELLRPPPASHLFAAHHPFAPAPAHRPSFDPHPSPFPPIDKADRSKPLPYSTPVLLKGGTVFGRYPAAGPFPPMPAYTSAHDPWARLQSARASMGPLAASGAWSAAKAEEERERRARREEKQRRANAAKAAVRERSPHSTPSKEDDLRPPPPPAASDLMRPHPPPADLLRPHPPPPVAADLLRAAPPSAAFQRHRLPPLPPNYPPSLWPDPYRYDPLRFGAMPTLRDEEEARAKLFGVFPGVGSLRPAPAKAPAPYSSKEDPTR